MRVRKVWKEDQLAVQDAQACLPPFLKSLGTGPSFNIFEVICHQLGQKEAIEHVTGNLRRHKSSFSVLLLQKLHECVDHFVVQPHSMIQTYQVPGAQGTNLQVPAAHCTGHDVGKHAFIRLRDAAGFS